MQKNFTSKTLLRYYYHELSPAQNLEVANAIANDYKTREAYLEICNTLRGLNVLRAQPTGACISRILEYSRDTSSSPVL